MLLQNNATVRIVCLYTSRYSLHGVADRGGCSVEILMLCVLYYNYDMVLRQINICVQSSQNGYSLVVFENCYRENCDVEDLLDQNMLMIRVAHWAMMFTVRLVSAV